LKKIPDAKVKVLVLWSPILSRDNMSSAVEASAFLTDSRAEHFWDLWSFGMRHYTQQLEYPSSEHAWDIFILYKSRLKWGATVPAPTFWWQNRNLSHGAKYNQKLLERELIRLLQR
jgi:hypothetical protein